MRAFHPRRLCAFDLEEQDPVAFRHRYAVDKVPSLRLRDAREGIDASEAGRIRRRPARDLGIELARKGGKGQKQNKKLVVARADILRGKPGSLERGRRAVT